MKRVFRSIALGTLAFMSVLMALPISNANAQVVVVRRRPVVVVHRPPPVVIVRRPPPVVVVRRPAPRVIVVRH